MRPDSNIQRVIQEAMPMLGPCSFVIVVVGVVISYLITTDWGSTFAAAEGIEVGPPSPIAVLWKQLSTNSMLQAMFWSSFIGSVLYLFSQLTILIQGKVMSNFFRSVTISSKDENYRSILEFLSSHCVKDEPQLTLSTAKRKKKTYKEYRAEWLGLAGGSAVIPQMDWMPSNTSGSISTFVYNGQRFLMSRSAGQTITTGYDRKPLDLENLTLSTWGKDNTHIKALIYDALKAAVKVQTEDLNIYVLNSSWMGGWERALSKKPRPLDSVVLDENLAHDLLADAKGFLESSDWYAARGIPYRRGYLLHGLPGCGKTSFCQVLAGALHLDVCMLNLTNSDLNDNSLAENLRDAPMNAIILLEDVDAVFSERSAGTDLKRSGAGVSFSGLLNALDGVASQEGRLFFMTTNHLERLDPALVRPGRCDVKVELRRASKNQMQRLFLRFFPGENEAAERFADMLPSEELSMAQMQGHLLENKTVDEALANVPKLLLATKPKPLSRVTSTWDFLRRVGLHSLTPAFEFHGYYSREEIHSASINVDTVCKWVPQLKYQSLEKKRLELLLSADKAFMDSEYALADLSAVRDSFIAAFPVGIALLTGEVPSHLRSSPSQGLVLRRSKSSVEAEARIEALCVQFEQVLTRGGKSLASMWQLRHLIALAGSDPEKALAYARVCTKSRAEIEEEGLAAGCYLDAFFESKRKQGKNDANSDALPPVHGSQSASGPGKNLQLVLSKSTSNSSYSSAPSSPVASSQRFAPLRPLSAQNFLKLAALDKYAQNCSAAGLNTLEDLIQAKDEALKVLIPADADEKASSDSGSGGKDGDAPAGDSPKKKKRGKGVKSDKKKKVAASISARDRAQLKLLLEANADRANLLRLLVCPDAASLRGTLRWSLPVLSEQQIETLVERLTDSSGNGFASMAQLQQFFAVLAAKSGDAAPSASAATQSDASLDIVTRKSVPLDSLIELIHSQLIQLPPVAAPVEPEQKEDEEDDPKTAWLRSWLSSEEAQKLSGSPEGYLEYVDNFAGAALYSAEDLVSDPPIDARELMEFGITKKGIMRAIGRMMTTLKDKYDAEQEAKGKKKKPAAVNE